MCHVQPWCLFEIGHPFKVSCHIFAAAGIKPHVFAQYRYIMAIASGVSTKKNANAPKAIESLLLFGFEQYLALCPLLLKM